MQIKIIQVKLLIRILTFKKYYLPGYRGGGPIRTLSNMASQLNDYTFNIITYDRDLNETRSYNGIIPGSWNKIYNDLLIDLFLSKIFRIPYIFYYIDIFHKLFPISYIRDLARIGAKLL